MRLLLAFTSYLAVATASIWQNSQLRTDPYPGQARLIDLANSSTLASWKAYNANASQLSYKGRWDSKHSTLYHSQQLLSFTNVLQSRGGAHQV